MSDPASCTSANPRKVIWHCLNCRRGRVAVAVAALLYVSSALARQGTKHACICLQVINTELFNVMRLAQRSYQRYHSPLDAELRHAADGSLSGNTLLKQMGAVTVDVPGCTAAVEAAALQAAFDQTDRVSWEWAMQSPVNATMYSKHSNMRRAVNRLVRSP